MPVFSRYLTGGSSANNHKIDFHVQLVQQDVANNRSLIARSLRLVHTSGTPGSWSLGTSTWATSIGGVTAINDDGTTTYDFRNNLYGQITLGARSDWFEHEDDGTLTLACGAIFTAAGNIGSANASGSYKLPTIARASKATFSPSSSFDAGSAVTINTNRKASFTHDITWSFGGLSGTVGNGVTTSTSWTPPLSLLEKIPNAASGSGSIKVVTKSGSTTVGTTTTGFTLKAPSSVVPTVSSVTVTDLNSDVATIVGKFVQGLSRAKFTVNGAGVYGSTIKSSTVTFEGNSVPASSDAPVTGSGDLPVTGRVTDSRGRAGTGTATLPVLPYVPPAITAYQVRRSNSAKVVQDDGAYLRVDLTGAIASLLNTTQRNAFTIRAFTRPRGGSVWTPRNVITGALTYNTSFLMSGGAIYSPTESYDVRVQLHDKFGAYVADTVVSTAAVALDLNGTAVGVGKIWEQGALDVAGQIFQDGEPVIDLSDRATPADMQAGVDDTKFVTPAQLGGDTGWVDITTLEPGFSVGDPIFRYRVKAGIVYIRGTVNGTFPNAAYTKFASNLPLEALPSNFMRFGAGASSAHAAFVEISPAGHMNAAHNSGTARAWVSFSLAFPQG